MLKDSFSPQPLPNPGIEQMLQLAINHHQAGRLQEAQQLYQQILQAQPNHPDALHYLGFLAHQVGQSAVAVNLMRQAIAINPQKGFYYSNLALVLRGQGNLREAVQAFSKAVELEPESAPAWYNLGMAFQEQGNWQEASRCFGKLVQLQPESVDAYNCWGIALKEQGKLAESAQAFQKALQLAPNSAGNYNNLGIIFQEQGKLAEAAQYFEKALELEPNLVVAYNNLAVALQEQGDLVSSTKFLRKALEIEPNCAETHYHLGMALKEQGQLTEAIKCYEQALQVKPDLIEAHNNLANIYQEQGNLTAAIQFYRQALKLQPDYLAAHSNLLFSLSASADFTPAEVLGEAENWYNQQVLARGLTPLAHHNDRNPERRLRIGYFSPDFRQHSVSYFIESVIQAHDRDRVEVYCYAQVRNPDAVTQRLEAAADKWRYTVGLTDEQLAQLIEQDGIDILIDLAGHTRGNRLRVFAMKPAPIQATYLGYFATTGLPTIDYWITDSVLHPEDTQEVTSEAIWRLPRCYVSYQPHPDSPPVSPPPCLRQGIVTFGSFNQLSKVSPASVALWARVLQGVPNSRLLLKTANLADSDEQERIKGMFAQQGISSERLLLRGKTPSQREHLAVYGEVDICLDTTPYTGCTTTCDALWMGIPVLTLAGMRKVGRMSASVLTAVGRGEWVAHSVEEFVAKAVELASQPQLLQRLRQQQRQEIEQSPLRDAQGLARALETAYRQMWYRYLEATGNREGNKGGKREGNRQQATGNREGNRQQATGNREGNKGGKREGNRQQATGNREGKREKGRGKKRQQAIGNKALNLSQTPNPKSKTAAQDKIRAAQNPKGDALPSALPDADFYRNLGDNLRQQGKLEEAGQAFQRALELEPNSAVTHYSLGSILQRQGKLGEAAQCYRQALALQPDLVYALNNLGNIYQAQNNLPEAMEAYRQAVTLKPDYALGYFNLGKVFNLLGNDEEAIACYRQALQGNPHFALAKFGLVISQLPVIYSSVEEIELKRHNYREHLYQLAASYQAASREERIEAAKAVGALQPFLLGYQGLNDRELQIVYGEMICNLMASCYPQYSQPKSLPSLAPNEKIRIGFASGKFCNHSVWKLPLRGWVENLDRKRFQLFGYHTDSRQDGETERASRAFDRFIQGHLPIEKWCEEISRDNLHILIFPEFGMEPMTLQLGCLRLAPIQMTSWGQPQTSGMPTIDYYLSSDLMEGENAQEHYSEKLVRLPHLSTYYIPQSTPARKVSRREIGIPEGEVMFWCCQSLFKYLPQDDDIFPRIAQQLGNCKFVFIEYRRGKYVTEIFSQRLGKAFAKFGLNSQDYCRFLPPLELGTFLGIAGIADVFLDSTNWCGCNTTLEALTQDIPVVTLPGDLMRGRHTLAILKILGIEETIAANKDEYIALALRLAKEPQYRQEIAHRIAQNKYKLYRDRTSIVALENLFIDLVGAQGLRPGEAGEAGGRGQEAGGFPPKGGIEGGRQQAIGREEHDKSADIETSQAMSLMEQGKLAEALVSFRQAQQLAPDSPFTNYNLGLALKMQGELAQAEQYYRQAVLLKPDWQDALNNLANVLKEQGKLQEAIQYYRQSLLLKPEDAKTHFNLAFALLLTGDFPEGLAEYEWRFQSHQPLPPLSQPRWQGENLQGKTLLLVAEQGYGDTIQFIRYAPLLAAKGARVKVVCDASLVRLCQTMEGIEEVSNTITGDYDYYLPLMSCPYLFETTLVTIPASIPYLFTGGNKEGKRQQATGNRKGKRQEATGNRESTAKTNQLKVGIFWASNKPNLANPKNCPLDLFIPLFSLAGVSFYSLQVGEEAAQIQPYLDEGKIYDLSCQIEDFADTAALIEQLDLIISIDTAIAHLAGAMGKPVWNLLPFSPDWRWLLERNNSPWYPTMRLFRQPQPGDWQSVLVEVGKALGEAIGMEEHDKLADVETSQAMFLMEQGKLAEALVNFRQAQQLAPDSPFPNYNLGLALKMQGELAQAEQYYRQAVLLKPDWQDALNNLANVLKEQGKLEEAIQYYRHLLQRHPNSAVALNNLGNALQAQGKLETAIDCFRQAIQLAPNFAQAHNNLGVALKEKGELPEAFSAYQQALQLKPDYPEAYNNLAVWLQEQGQLNEAIQAYRQALKLEPNYTQAHSNLLFLLGASATVTPQQMLEEARAWQQQQITNQGIIPFSHPQANPKKRLRIGYISPDFRQHVVSHFIEPVIQYHDRDRVEVYCYAEVKFPDAVSQRLQEVADVWRFTIGLSDLQVAQLIQQDKIDILIDLAGHTRHNRLKALAYKPAPLQATYLGYFATTGLTALDYWITDAVLHSDNTQEKTTETIWRLPRCYISYQPDAEAPPVSPPPCLEQGIITFGCFNNFQKITPATVKLWARVLQTLPKTRLLLKAAALALPPKQQHLQQLFAQEGIASERLLLRGWTSSSQENLAMYNEVDICLDTIPYTGCTTTCDALWMGVPVLTLAGIRKVERMSASILTAVGREEWIAHSEAEFIAKAEKLASNPQRLQQLRQQQRQQIAQSPLGDGEGLARALEAAYEQMWQDYLNVS